MGKVYKTQSKLTLYIDTGTDLTEASSVAIHRTDPEGTSSSTLTAVIENASTGLISYEVSATDFIIAGVWILWVKVTYTGGAVAYGEPFRLHFHDAGT